MNPLSVIATLGSALAAGFDAAHQDRNRDDAEWMLSRDECHQHASKAEACVQCRVCGAVDRNHLDRTC